MAWSNSKVFQEWVNGPMFQASGTSYTGLDSDTVKAALFNNSVTPDQNAAVASTGFNTGTWTTSNEVTDATNWVSGGRGHWRARRSPPARRRPRSTRPTSRAAAR